MENTENHNFEKNYIAVRRFNPKLAEILIQTSEINEDIQLIYNRLNEPNLSYNGIPLHSDSGAEIEARKIFKQASNSPLSIHVVFGLGLGYLFKEFVQNSKGLVILYEPDIQLLRLTLELVDFSSELSKNNVRIVSNLNDLKSTIINNYKYKAESTFSSLPSYQKIYQNEIAGIISSLQIVIGTCLSECNTTKKFLSYATVISINNFPMLLDETPLAELRDKFKGKTALLISAGPSLDKNIKTIKNNRNKFVIFVVGTAYKALLRNGVKPDFINIVEPKDCFYQIQDTDLSDIYLILEPSTHKLFHQAAAKKKFSYIANTNPINIAWAKFANIGIEGYENKGTVSFQAITSAKMLGFKRIILVGQDLAYVNNQCYSKDSVFSDLICEINPKTNKMEIRPKDYEHYKESIYTKNVGHTQELAEWFVNQRLQQLNDSLFFVKGVQGNTLPTEATFATYIEHFKEFAKNNPDLELINSSMIGANIDGFKNIPLEDALKDVEPINEEISLDSDFKYDKDFILKNITNEISFLENVISGIQETGKYFDRYNRAYKKTNSINEETNKYFKVLLNYYDQLKIEANKKSCLFTAISFAEDIEIQYLLSKAEVVDENVITEVFNALKRYYELVQSNAKAVLSDLKNIKETIK